MGAAGLARWISGCAMQSGMMARPQLRWQYLVATALVLLCPASPMRASWQDAVAAGDQTGGKLIEKPPRFWIERAAANEIVALHHKDSHLRYRMHSVNEKGDQVRDVIESLDGTVARLIMRDGKPLTPEQDAAERQRLTDLLASPSAYARHARNSESEKKTADRLVPLMPDAGLFSYVAGQPQTGSNSGRPEIVIDYRPNPNFVPPTTEAQALTGLEGRVWIDAKTGYLVRMEGTISHAVNFGWGMLAHIYPGGKLALNQTEAGEDRWIFTDFSMNLIVRALMVKTLKVDSHVQAGNFQFIAPMSYQSAIHTLLDTPPVVP